MRARKGAPGVHCDVALALMVEVFLFPLSSFPFALQLMCMLLVQAEA